MTDKVAPGSAGHGLFRATPGGKVFFDPQGGDGDWPEGLTQTRLRGLLRDAQGRLTVGDLAQVDVSRVPESPVPADVAAIWDPATGRVGGIFDLRTSAIWTDAAMTQPAAGGDPIGAIAPIVGDYILPAPDDAARPLLSLDRRILTFDGVANHFRAGPPNGLNVSEMLFATCAEETTAAAVSLMEVGAAWDMQTGGWSFDLRVSSGWGLSAEVPNTAFYLPKAIYTGHVTTSTGESVGRVYKDGVQAGEDPRALAFTNSETNRSFVVGCGLRDSDTNPWRHYGGRIYDVFAFVSGGTPLTPTEIGLINSFVMERSA